MSQETRLRLDDLVIDLERQCVHRGALALPVSGLSFRLLAHFLRAGTQPVSFDELIEAVWAPAVVNEETVTQRVKLLRQALGDDSRNPRYLRSVRGVGYQLCVAPTVAIEPPSPSVGVGVRRQGLASRWRVVAAFALVAIVLATKTRENPGQSAVLAPG